MKRKNYLLRVIFILATIHGVSHLMMPIHSFAQITFLGDNNQAKSDANISEFTEVGNNVYFATRTLNQTGDFEPHLWITDKTESGTAEVGENFIKDLMLIPYFYGDIFLKDFTALNGELYFVLRNSAESTAFFCKTDGTDNGTILLKEFNEAHSLIAVGNILFFVADDGTYGSELWKSDGTPAGTQLVKDINLEFIGEKSSEPKGLSAYGSTLIFTAFTNEFGRDLWKSDGTESGTQKIKEFSANIYMPQAIEYDNTLLMSFNHGNSGTKLWKTDGTESGTELVKDISNPQAFIHYNGSIYFSAGGDLWKTDGTSAGTSFVYDYGSTKYTLANGKLYWCDDDYLYESDGTSGGTSSVSTLAHDDATVLGELNSKPIICCEGNGSQWVYSHGFELWEYDGTSLTEIVDLYPGEKSGVTPDNAYNPTFIVSGNSILFYGNNGTGSTLWMTDGTIAGTVKVKAVNDNGVIPNYEHPPYQTPLGDGIVFSVENTGGEIWKSDGTPAGTFKLADGEQVKEKRLAGFMQSNGNKAFMATTWSIWTSDGTSGGTTELFPTWSFFGNAGKIHKPSGKLIFTNSNNISQGVSSPSGAEPWVSDGTEAGTFRLKDLKPGGGPLGSSLPNNFTATDSLVFFSATPDDAGTELYVSDGTVSGTHQVGETVPMYTPGGNIGKTCIYASYLAISNTRALMRSDGSDAGTYMIKDMGAECSNFNAFDSLVAFKVGGSWPNLGLWITDGTENGTVQLTQKYSSDYSDFYALDSLFYFLYGDDDLQGKKLYRSNGTLNGTWEILDRIKDIEVFNDKLFLIQNQIEGYSVFYSFDGSIESMVQVPGSEGLDGFHSLVASGDNLFFHAWEYETGDELYAYAVPEDPVFSIRSQYILREGYKKNYIYPLVNGDTTEHSYCDIGEASLDVTITSSQYKFIISNAGGSTLQLNPEPELLGPHKDYFELLDFPSHIEPMEVDSFNIQFTGNPTDGKQYADIQINTNDPSMPVFKFRVFATSKSQAEMQLISFATPGYNGNQSDLYGDFGTVVISDTSKDTIKIVNAGYGNPLLIESLEITGDAAADFSINVSNDSVLAYNYYTIPSIDAKRDSISNNPKYFSNFEITFSPTQSGFREALLTINASGELTNWGNKIYLIGEGTCMEIDSISPAVVDPLCAGSDDSVTLTIPSMPNSTYCWGTFENWKTIGLADFHTQYTVNSVLKFDSDNNPVLAFIDNNLKLSVMQYENEIWSFIGQEGFVTTYARYYNYQYIDPSFDLEIGANDTLYVFFKNTSRKATAMKFNGTSWEYLGQDGFSEGEASNLSMATVNGIPAVAYIDKGILDRGIVKQFSGTDWEPVGGNSITPASAKYPDIEAYGETLFVALQDGSAPNQGATLYKLDNNAWVPVGNKGVSDGAAEFINLEFNASGDPHLSFLDNANGDKMTVLNYAENSWGSVGNNGFSKTLGELSRTPGLEINGGIPYISFTFNYGTLSVMGYESERWETIGEESLPGTSVFAYSVNADNNGVLHLFYNQLNKFNLKSYTTTQTCLGTENILKTDKPGFYKVLVTNTNTDCMVSSPNTVEVKKKVCNPSIALRGNGVYIASGDDTPGNDDHTIIGTTTLEDTISRTYYIVNYGDGELVISDSVMILGSDSIHFRVVNQPPNTIAPGDSIPFTVEFSADTYSVFEATIEINSNDPQSPKYTYLVKAATSAIEISLTDVIVTDQNDNGYVDEGDVIRYTAIITNPDGAPALNDVTLMIGLGSVGTGGIIVDNSVNSTLGTVSGNQGFYTIAFTGISPDVTVTVNFDIQVNYLYGATIVTNQVLLRDDNAAMMDILSDDPDLSGTQDPTETAVTPQCTNPDTAGAIGSDQNICSGTAPEPITSLWLPGGETGTLEFKWQQSTSSSTTGFTDIANSNSASYAPGNLSATTWFKRLARVDCMDDWSGAVASNVVEITVPAVAVPMLTLQSNTSTTAKESTANGSIVQVCENASNRGAIWYVYTNTDKSIGNDGVTNVSEDGDFGEGDFSASLTGLEANTRYNVRAHATNPDGTGYSERADFRTLANVPAAPTVDDATFTTLDVTVNANGNPAGTEFCINEISTGKFVQADGSLNTSGIWLTKASWGTKTVTGLTTGVTYTFQVKARNADNIETGYGPSEQGVPVAAPSVSTQAASAITTNAATGNGTITSTNGDNATNRGLIWYPFTDTDKAIGDAKVTNVAEDGDFTAEPFTADFTGLDVNMHYNVRAHATNPQGTGYGDRVDFWTLANVPAAPTVDGATATSLDVMVNVNGNPAGTEYCINESGTTMFVQADGSLNTTEVWQTATAWGTVTINNLNTSETYTFRVKARNGELIETTYSEEASGTTCTNPADGGIIAADQLICEGSIPNPLTSTSGATGHGGTLEYKWQQSTSSSTTGFSDIENSNSESYAPGNLYATTWFKRLARVDCMDDWTGAVESNVVEIAVYDAFNPGEIQTDGETICYEGDPMEIGSSADAGGGDGLITYSWEFSTDDFTTPGTEIVDATSPNYDPPAGLTVTTSYRRYAKDGSCNTSFVPSAGTWTVTVQEKPEADAGNDATVVEGETHILATGNAEQYTSVNWSSDGDGNFDNAGVLNPEYTPGSDDIANGEVELCMEALPVSPCLLSDTDCMTLTILRHPEVEIVSPADGEHNYDYPLTVAGTASDADGDLSKVMVRYNNGQWENATGTDNWNTELHLLFGNFVLEAKAVDSEGLESEIKQVTFFNSVHQVPLYDGWSMISSFLDPHNHDLETLMAGPVGQNLVVVMINNQGNIFWPSQNLNLIGDWTTAAAYKVLMNGETSLILGGETVNETTLSLDAGVNYLPVLSNVETPIADAFENPMQDIRVIYENHTNHIYWPDGGIFSLSALTPGMGYLANMKNPAQVTFPDYDMIPDGTSMPKSGIITEGPWPVTRTGNVHLVSVSADALAEIQDSDFLGAFDSEGNCFGFAETGNGKENVLLTVYGNDAHSSAKDGTVEGEQVSFRTWSYNDGENPVTAIYNEHFPNHDGSFTTGGLSMISLFLKSSTGVANPTENESIRIYPNPADDEIHFVNIKLSTISAVLINAEGVAFKSLLLEPGKTSIRVDNLPPGVYFLKLIQNNHLQMRKVIIK